MCQGSGGSDSTPNAPLAAVTSTVAANAPLDTGTSNGGLGTSNGRKGQAQSLFIALGTGFLGTIMM